MGITAKSVQNYQVEINAGSHRFLSDEPPGLGGDDAGPNPFDLLLGGLASCTIITLHMYAKRKDWPLERVEMEVDMESIETVGDDGQKHRVSQINNVFRFFGPLADDQRRRLEEIANRCPVHRTLLGEISIVSNVEKPTGGG